MTEFDSLNFEDHTSGYCFGTQKVPSLYGFDMLKSLDKKDMAACFKN